MGRAVLAVIAGYVALFLVTFATFSAAYLAMGTDGAFKPGSFDPSAPWIATMFVLGFGAAVVGGMVCAVVAKSPKPPMVLAGLIVVLGLIMAVPVLMAQGESPPRPGDLGNLEAMQQARQPGWVAVVNPFIGLAGVLLGARLVSRGKS